MSDRHTGPPTSAPVRSTSWTQDEQKPKRVGSLFSGIGGLELALEMHGFETAWQCEVDPAAASVLARQWPGVPNLGDITQVDWSEVEPVDVLCGGFPCQDISLAGLGAGITEGTRSGLWSYFHEAISHLRPSFVFVENVAALTIRGLDRVAADLASIGFDAEWSTFRASDVGAPHRRDRFWLVARPSDADTDSLAWPAGSARSGQRRALAQSSEVERTERLRGGASADTSGERSSSSFQSDRDQQTIAELGDDDLAGDAADTKSQRWSRWHPAVQSSREHGHASDEDRQAGRRRASADTDSERLEGHRPELELVAAGEEAQAGWLDPPAFGRYGPAVERWSSIIERPAPAPTDERGRLSADFVGWMMGFPAGWTDGLKRKDQLKAYGNAVVPQCAAAAFAGLVARFDG